MSGKFTFRREDTGERSRIVLEGVIDEDALLEKAFTDLKPGVDVDLRGILRINSCGIRSWVNLIGSISEDHDVIFQGCAPVIVRQLNMISNFGGRGKVQSFMLPYYCARCDKEQDIEVDTDAFLAKHPDCSAPGQACASCNGQLEFDDIEEKYFHFLRQR
ncbi:MAG: hypothetical protein GF418_11660 [Chitinivibrionales bacterium]|nr:hypothetical protein [Chitinivibrionales bacterium]MBD3396272.1 hypothetical protein [Chitinivibrionales bacterium]